jgi:hypothetical protein
VLSIPRTFRWPRILSSSGRFRAARLDKVISAQMAAQ